MFRNRELIAQFCRFGVVGIISVMVDYSVLIAFTESNALGYFEASAFSYTLSVMVNYVLSMRYVFHAREDMSKVKEATIFFVLSFIGLALNQMVMWVAVEFFHIYYALAKLLSTMMVTNYNFISRKTFLE